MTPAPSSDTSSAAVLAALTHADAAWALADAELREAAWVGADLHLRLSALPVSWRGEGGRTEHGHVSGLALVCVGAQGVQGAPLAEALGRLHEGQWRASAQPGEPGEPGEPGQPPSAWQRRWPLASPVPGPLHLVLGLPHRSELALNTLGLHLLPWGPLRLYPSLAC